MGADQHRDTAPPPCVQQMRPKISPVHVVTYESRGLEHCARAGLLCSPGEVDVLAVDDGGEVPIVRRTERNGRRSAELLVESTHSLEHRAPVRDVARDVEAVFTFGVHRVTERAEVRALRW